MQKKRTVTGMANVEKVISVLLDEKNWETLTGIDGVPSFAMDAEVLLKSQQAEIEQLNRFVNGFSRDAMPVVRCKDCRFGEKSVSPFWKMFCNRHDRHVDSDDYCSNGERKDGDVDV